MWIVGRFAADHAKGQMTTLQPGLSFRAYSDGDESGVFELWKATHAGVRCEWDMWLADWRWKFEENPAGRGIIWVAEDGGRIVGHYAVIPVLVRVGTETQVMYQSVDTMTHPDYRRRGVFVSLAERLFGTIDRTHQGVVFGFPNSLSLRGFVGKLGFVRVTNVPLAVNTLNWPNSLRTHVRSKPALMVAAKGGKLVQSLFYNVRPYDNPAGTMIRTVERFDDRIDQLWGKTCWRHKIVVVRNKDYLNWRYSPPRVEFTRYVAERGAEILGYSVVRFERLRNEARAGIVFDLLAESEEVAGCLIGEVRRYLALERGDFVYTQSKTDAMYRRAFKRNGFVQVPLLRALPLVVRTGAVDSCEARKYLTTKSNWFIEIGDSDAV